MPNYVVVGPYLLKSRSKTVNLDPRATGSVSGNTNNANANDIVVDDF